MIADAKSRIFVIDLCGGNQRRPWLGQLSGASRRYGVIGDPPGDGSNASNLGNTALLAIFGNQCGFLCSA
jgi:hypothetical protein